MEWNGRPHASIFLPKKSDRSWCARQSRERGRPWSVQAKLTGTPATIATATATAATRDATVPISIKVSSMDQENQILSLDQIATVRTYPIIPRTFITS
jgi:hypothetical protein